MSEKENGISRGGVLPSPLTSFIGRKQQLAELRLLLLAASMEGTTGRLITLAGAGGCGKTRLALQAAGALPEEAGLQGAWFVELAALTDAALIPQAIMAVLDIQQTGETPPLEALLNFLRARRLLLILDNCEHLVDGCAALVARLLQTCPHLVVLATSRETLDVPGEVVYRVPPMAIPDDAQPGALLQSEAVQLFVERARAASPGNVQAFEREAPLVGQICHRLDGIPLAIELAAARTHLLSLEQIAARLDDCFRLLTGGSRTDLPHHQTLRATMDWSYNLLDESEQRLFWRLSLFAGGWTLEAAEAVCSDPDGHASADPGRLDRAEILDLLGGLVAKSMIHVLHSVPQTGSLAAAPTPVHYSMLETLRQYAREKLAAAGELDRLQERFLAYYRDLAEQARAGFRGPQQNTWLVRMEQETNNLHAALEYAFPTPDSASGPSEQGIYLAGSLFAFWRRSGNHAEFVAWRDRILAVCDRQPLTPGLVRALTNAGMEMWLFKPPAFSFRILPMLEAGITVLDGEGETGRVDYARLLTLIGFIYLRTPGRLPEGRAYVEHGLAILRQAGASWELASALFLSGYPLYHMHHDESVLAWFEESTALFRQVGDRMAWGEATAHLGSCAVARGDLESASRYFQESVEILLEGGPSLAKPTCSGLINLGEVARCQGDYDRAGACYRRALRVLEQAGLMQGGPATESYTTAYWNLGFVELHRGNIEQALVCFRSGRSEVSYDDELDQEQYEIRDLLAYASLAAAMGKSEAAAHLLGANDALWHQLEADRPGMQFYDPADQLEIEHYQGMVQDQLGPEAYAAAWQAGRQMDLEQAQRYAHDLFPG